MADSEKPLRLFAAIMLPPGIKEKISSLNEEFLRADAAFKPVKPENLHITLKFIGLAEGNKIKDIKNIMEKTAAETEPFRLHFRGVGAFPAAGAPLLLWAGAEDENGGLSALALKLENRFSVIGVKKERKPFHPHITTARLKKKIKNKNSRTPAKHYLAKNRGADFGSMEVKRVSLIQSTLTGEGAFYSEVSGYDIKKPLPE